MLDGGEIRRHDLWLGELVGTEPTDFGDLAVPGVPPCAEATSEDDPEELDNPSVRVAMDLGRRTTQHSKEAVQFDFTAEFLATLSASAVGERFAGLESAAGQAPRPVVAASTQKNPSVTIHNRHARGWHESRRARIVRLHVTKSTVA